MTRTEAAHLNGARSRGPVTDEGKARSAQNACTHGLTSSQVVIPGENQAEFEALFQSYRDTWMPATPQEEDLICEIVASRWRLRRTSMMEKAVIETEMHRIASDKENPIVDPELARAMVWANVAGSQAMKQIHRHETRLRRAYEKAIKELTLLQQTRAEAEKQAARETQSPRPQPVLVAKQEPTEPENPRMQNEPVAAPGGPPNLRAA